MKNSLKNKISKTLNRLHLFIFGSNMGNKSKDFVKNISLSFSGGMIGFAVLFAASVVAARVLGPEQYGIYSVVFSIAQMLALFYVLELDVSTLYFLAKKTSKNKKITASINVMFLINIVVFTFLAVSIYQSFAPDNISKLAFVGAIVMALTFALKRMADAYLRVNDKFARQATLKIVESITVISVLVVLFWGIGQTDYFAYVMSIILGGTVFTVLSAVTLKDVFMIRAANMEYMNKVFSYNIFGVISAAVNSVIKNIDKLIVVAFLGAAMGGIYTVYFTASVIIGARLTQLFINVFFPTVRANSDRTKSVFRKINKLFKRTFVLSIIACSIGVLFIVWLYGSEYPIVWTWIVLSGIYISVHFFASLYGWLLSSVSREGYKKYNISFVYSFFAYGVMLALAFTQDSFGISVLLGALIVYRIVGGTVSFFELKRQVL